MELKTTRYEVEDGIATVTLSRPQRRNAWTGRMHTEYRWILSQADQDRDVRVIVVTGDPAGQAFCAGADLEALEGHSEKGRYDPGTAEDIATPGFGVDPHFDAGEIRLQWQPAPPGHPFRIEVDGVEAGRVDDVTAGEVTVALAATDAAWGVRRIAIVSDDSLTPRLTELRVLRRLGEEPPVATD